MRKYQAPSGETICYITDEAEARVILKKIAKHPHPGALDFETTSLVPDGRDNGEPGYVRLSNLSISSTVSYVFDHHFIGDFETWAEDFADANDFYVFNIGFEGAWFQLALGDEDLEPVLYDVGVMRKSVMGGGPLSLKLQVLWDLKIKMNKEEQVSDWEAETLTESQIVYAGLDACYTYRLGRQWSDRMTPDHWRGFYPLNECWRGVNEMQSAGFTLDVIHHRKLIRMWEARKRVAERAIRKIVPSSHWENLQSPIQLSNFLKTVLDKDAVNAWPKTEKAQKLDTSRTILRQTSFRSPYPFSRFLAAVMVFNRANKYLGTYGEKLINSQAMAGKIYPRFNIAQAVTGRFSSSGAMNAQNLPRAPLVRRSFIAPLGKTLVLADYSGIELRVLAEVSGDEQLKHDVIFGNVHAESAITIFDLDKADFYEALERKEPFAKELRAKAKAFSFQLTYGAAAGALSLVLRCSEDEAAEFIEKWAKRYPKAYQFRQFMFEKMRSSGFLPVTSGRSIFVPRADRSVPVASNYPIQGAAADVMYNAINYVYDRLNRYEMNAYLLGTVHDELLLVSGKKEAVEVEKQLIAGMEEGWLHVFPNTPVDNLIESAIGWSWAAKP